MVTFWPLVGDGPEPSCLMVFVTPILEVEVEN